MRKSVRRVIFYIFFGAFCVLAPLIVLYTAGYRFSIKSGIDLDVGSLSITTSPKRVSVSINEAPAEKRTPHVFQELQPGRYRIELTRTGYLPWHGTVSIFPGLTTYLQHIVLFRDSEPTIAVSDLSANGNVAGYQQYAAYTTPISNEVQSLHITNLKSGHDIVLGEIPSETVVDFTWSYDGKYLLTNKKGSTEETSLYTYRGEDITPSWSELSEKRWDTSNDIIYAMQANGTPLFYDVEMQTFSDPLPQGYLGIVEDSLFFIKQGFTSSILSVKQVHGDQEQELVNLPRSTYALLGVHPPNLALQDAQGDLFIIEPASRSVIQAPAKNSRFAWSDITGGIAYTDGTEFNLLTPQQQQRDMLLRTSNPLTHIAWHPSGQRLLFSQDGLLMGIDVYLYGLVRDQVTLATFESIETFWLDQKGRTTYVLGVLNGKRSIYTLRLH